MSRAFSLISDTAASITKRRIVTAKPVPIRPKAIFRGCAVRKPVTTTISRGRTFSATHRKALGEKMHVALTTVHRFAALPNWL